MQPVDGEVRRVQRKEGSEQEVAEKIEERRGGNGVETERDEVRGEEKQRKAAGDSVGQMDSTVQSGIWP